MLNIDSFENIITDQNNTIKMLRENLNNLLATIHKDGGHYVEKHGMETATVDAIEKWHMTQINFNDAKNRVQELAHVIQRKDKVIAEQEKTNDELKRDAKNLINFIKALRGEWENSLKYGSNPMTPEIIIAMNFILEPNNQ